jgi:transcriptional regulator CtsR
VVTLAKLSDLIEAHINAIIDKASTDSIEIQRNILAQKFNCAPSQINYVLTTRFGNERGYVVESKRGGGGYVRIYKIKANPDKHIDTILREVIGESVTKGQAESILNSLMDKKIVSKREMQVMLRALSDRALGKIFHGDRNTIRADLLREMLLILI